MFVSFVDLPVFDHSRATAFYVEKLGCELRWQSGAHHERRADRRDYRLRPANPEQLRQSPWCEPQRSWLDRFPGLGSLPKAPHT